MFPGEGGIKKNPAVGAAGFFVGSLHAKTKAARSWFYLGMNRSRCQKPPVSADGGSRRSYSPAAVLPQPGLPVDILDLRVLRSRAAVLHGRVPRPCAAPAASRSQPASSAKRRGSAGSSRPSEAAIVVAAHAESVTDQGSQSASSGSPSERGKAITTPAAVPLHVRPSDQRGFWLRCMVCGRVGRLIDPFPRTSIRR